MKFRVNYFRLLRIFFKLYFHFSNLSCSVALFGYVDGINNDGNNEEMQ